MFLALLHKTTMIKYGSPKSKEYRRLILGLKLRSIEIPKKF